MIATSRKTIATFAPGSSMEGTPRLSLFLLACALTLILSRTAARADWIPTNFGSGADAEVRDHQPTTNFGASTELGIRVLNNFPPGHASDFTDRFSVIYTRFDLTGQTITPPFTAAFRLTFRNTSLAGNRLHDSITPNFDHRVGLAIYSLSTTAPAWAENTITYSNAPGIIADTDIGDNDLDFSVLTHLGTVNLPRLGVQNRLAVGASVVFRSPRLDSFILNAIGAGATQVTLVTILLHSGEESLTDWRNFNYLFNPKEQLTLNTDTGYDSDTTNPSNPLGGPHSAASNSTGTFSPAIRIDPLPATDPLPPLSIINVDSDRVDLQVGPTAFDGYPYFIERSLDLYRWGRIGTVAAGLIPVPWSDERLPGETKKFYRLTR